LIYLLIYLVSYSFIYSFSILWGACGMEMPSPQTAESNSTAK